MHTACLHCRLMYTRDSVVLYNRTFGAYILPPSVQVLAKLCPRIYCPQITGPGRVAKALPGACRIDVEWVRGRLFDQDAARLFQVLVKEARSMRCTGVTTKEERRPRPHGDLPLSRAGHRPYLKRRPCSDSERAAKLFWPDLLSCVPAPCNQRNTAICPNV